MIAPDRTPKFRYCIAELAGPYLIAMLVVVRGLGTALRPTVGIFVARCAVVVSSSEGSAPVIAQAPFKIALIFTLRLANASFIPSFCVVTAGCSADSDPLLST